MFPGCSELGPHWPDSAGWWAGGWKWSLLEVWCAGGTEAAHTVVHQNHKLCQGTFVCVFVLNTFFFQILFVKFWYKLFTCHLRRHCWSSLLDLDLEYSLVQLYFHKSSMYVYVSGVVWTAGLQLHTGQNAVVDPCDNNLGWHFSSSCSPACLVLAIRPLETIIGRLASPEHGDRPVESGYYHQAAWLTDGKTATAQRWRDLLQGEISTVWTYLSHWFMHYTLYMQSM